MTFHSIERLGAPFRCVAELGVGIPTEGEVRLDNRERKLLFFLEASCQLRVDDSPPDTVSDGDVIVMPRQCKQVYMRHSGGSAARLHVLKVVFSLPPIRSQVRTAPGRRRTLRPEDDLGDFILHHFTGYRHLKSAQTPAMQEILRAIRSEAEHRQPGARHRVRALATNLVIHVARLLHLPGEKDQAPKDAHAHLVNRTKEYILRNFGRPLSLGQIAWSVRKSDEHVARVFRRRTGQTVFDYVRAVRIEQAKTLLIHSDCTMGEIAVRTGFASLPLFSRVFRQQVGKTPTLYRAERAQRVRFLPK